MEIGKNSFVLSSFRMPIGNTIYLFTRKQMGDDNELGRKLIRGFLGNLAKQEVLPKLLFFLNEGTFLVCTEDETLLTPGSGYRSVQDLPGLLQHPCGEDASGSCWNLSGVRKAYH